jgi:hypothetical protein
VSPGFALFERHMRVIAARRNTEGAPASEGGRYKGENNPRERSKLRPYKVGRVAKIVG